MGSRGMILGFLVYLVVGSYFLNSGLNFVTLPEVLLKIDKWMLVLGGALIILGGVNLFRASRHY